MNFLFFFYYGKPTIGKKNPPHKPNSSWGGRWRRPDGSGHRTGDALTRPQAFPSQHRNERLFLRPSLALPSPFLRSSHTQRVWLSMPTPCQHLANTLPTPCLHLANTLPRVCEKLPIDDAGGEQKGVSGGEVALTEDALRQGYILLLKNHQPSLCRMIINQDLL